MGALDDLMAYGRQWVDDEYQKGMERNKQLSPKTVMGELIGGALNLMPASRMAVPRQGIRAYHGSPYDFDRFDMSKIGRGEGSQEMGHGIYFAEDPMVAQSYKDAANHPSVRRTREGAGFQVDPRMYEVNIRSNPEEFLNFDAGVQLPQVQAKLDSAGILSRGGWRRYGATAAEAKALADAGIPGMRYREPTSEGTSNYVLFNDQIIDIMKKWGLAAGPLGALMFGNDSQAAPMKQ